MLVNGNNYSLTLLLGNGDGDDFWRKPPGLLRGDGPLVTAQGEGILVGAAYFVTRCHVLRRLAHAIGVVHGGEARIDETPAERCVVEVHTAAEGAICLAEDKRRTRHILHATRDNDIAHTSLNGLGRTID